MGVENNVNGNNRITAWMMMMAKGEVMIRIAALVATIVATLVMGLNKESKSATVAVVGNTPIFQTITARFQDTPAFIYFLIANGIASGYNFVVLSLRLIFSKSWASNIAVHLLDLVILGLVESGAGAAASMAELGKNGNMAARWNPICNNFHTFCTRGGLAIVASSIGALLLLILTMLSIITLHNNVNANKPQVVAP